MLAITVCASKLYLKILKSCIRRIIASSCHINEITFIFVSDASEDCQKASDMIKNEIPQEWKFIHEKINVDADKVGEKYKINSQLLIAKMQGEAFAIARKIKADYVFNVEADILVRSDTLRVLKWALDMPTHDGTPYYDIALATYPNGSFIGGHGDYLHPIAEDFLPEERLLTKELNTLYLKIKK